MTAEEGVDQRVGEADDLANGQETGACDLPEGCLWEVFAPEDLPADDCAFVGTEACGKLTDPAWCRPLPHGADQDDDGGQVDLSAQEAHRRRRRSLPATVAIAAEAQSDEPGLRKLGGSALGLARVVGAVQAATARAAFIAGFGREIFVDCPQERPEAGGTEEIRDTWSSTPMSWQTTEYTSRRARSSDQALRGEFSWQPQRSCSGIADFTSISLATLTKG